ncbi:MAG: HlyD family efflux transporter periplasmic adaptor subunit [Kofleriaceae bacterium]
MKYALILLVACSGAKQHEQRHEDQRMGAVTRGTLVERSVLTGELRAPSAVDFVVPRTDQWEIAIRWLAEDGAEVKAGDRIVEFDNSSVTNTLEQQRLALTDAEMAYRSAKDLSDIDTQAKKNAVEQHKVALEKAKVKADVPPDLIATRDLQERKLDEKRMEAELAKSISDLDAQQREAKLDMEVKQIELDKAKRAIANAEATIDAMSLKAPKDGIVIVSNHPWEGRKWRISDTTQPGMSIATMPDVTQAMEVHSELSDVDDGRVVPGQAGTCTLDAYPNEPIGCKVSAITPVARMKGNQSLRRAFDVKIALEKTDQTKLRPGMSVKIVMPKPAGAPQLLVPRGAKLDASIKLGACDAQHCIVESGLTEGQQVPL